MILVWYIVSNPVALWMLWLRSKINKAGWLCHLENSPWILSNERFSFFGQEFRDGITFEIFWSHVSRSTNKSGCPSKIFQQISGPISPRCESYRSFFEALVSWIITSNCSTILLAIDGSQIFTKVRSKPLFCKSSTGQRMESGNFLHCHIPIHRIKRNSDDCLADWFQEF